MGALGIVDQRHGRPRQACQVGDLAGVVHAHLDHGGAMTGAQPQQHQRQADVVVEVADGGQHRFHRLQIVATLMLAQDGGAHLLDRGLAIAAGDADQRQIELAPPVTGQAAQRQAGVGHAQQRQAPPVIGGPGVIDHGGGGAMGQHVAHVVVTIEAFSVQRDEQFADGDRARVGRDADERVALRAGGAAGGLRGFEEIHHDNISRACRTCSRSENGRRRPAIS